MIKAFNFIEMLMSYTKNLLQQFNDKWFVNVCVIFYQLVLPIDKTIVLSVIVCVCISFIYLNNEFLSDYIWIIELLSDYIWIMNCSAIIFE